MFQLIEVMLQVYAKGLIFDTIKRNPSYPAMFVVFLVYHAALFVNVLYPPILLRRNEVRLQRDATYVLDSVLDAIYASLPFVFLAFGIRSQPLLIPHNPLEYTSNLVPIIHTHFVLATLEAHAKRKGSPARVHASTADDEGNAETSAVHGNDASETDGKKDRRLPPWACLLYFLVTGGFAISSATGATSHTINRQANYYGGNICYPCDCVAKRPGFHVWRSCTLYHNTVSIVWRRSSWNRQLKIKDRMKYHYDTIAEIKPQAFDGGLEKMTYLNLEKNDLTRIRSGAFDGLDSLDRLILWGNDIATLDEGAFRGLGKLETLDLRDNPRLSSLPPSLLDLPRLKAVYLGGTAICAGNAPAENITDTPKALLEAGLVSCTLEHRGAPLPPSFNPCRGMATEDFADRESAPGVEFW